MELDVNQIKEILPHRYPMLLLDRIIELDPLKYAVGIKCVTVNEPFFQGHFPENRSCRALSSARPWHRWAVSPSSIRKKTEDCSRSSPVWTRYGSVLR